MANQTPILLKTADNITFEVDPIIANEMETVKIFISDENHSPSTVIPLPNVSSPQMTTIIEYLNQHRLGDAKEFDAEFTKPMSLRDLKQLIIAANYLNVKGLYSLLAQHIADRLENKSVEFARKFFGVDNDFTPEEEKAIREKNAWAFTGVEEDDEEEMNQL